MGENAMIGTDNLSLLLLFQQRPCYKRRMNKRLYRCERGFERDLMV